MCVCVAPFSLLIDEVAPPKLNSMPKIKKTTLGLLEESVGAVTSGTEKRFIIPTADDDKRVYYTIYWLIATRVEVLLGL